MAFHDTDILQGRFQEAFAACRQAVEVELSKQPVDIWSPETESDHAEKACDSLSTTVRPPNKPIVPLATQRQIDFAYYLAREIRSLGGQRLPVLVLQLYDRKIEELTSPETSRLIDLLKELRAGSRSVDDLLAGTAA